MNTIIYITRTKIEVYEVNGESAKKVAKSGWSKVELPKLMGQLKDNFGLKKARVLIGENLSYELILPLPQDDLDKRTFLAEEIAKKIPEKLADYDWDFVNVVTNDSPNKKQAFVFAPVKEIWHSLSEAAAKAEIEFEAVEPVSWASKRDTNPIIGLSLKRDLKGKDEEILNLKPVSPFQKEASPPVSRGVIVVFVAAVILGAFTTGGIMVSRNALKKIDEEKAARDQASVILSEQAIAEPIEASPSAQEEIDLSQYLVQVLNGSGSGGEAVYAKQLLSLEGFETIETGDAQSSRHEATTVALKKAVPEAVFDAIKESLGDAYQVQPAIDSLSKDAQYDAVVTIGKRIK